MTGCDVLKSPYTVIPNLFRDLDLRKWSEVGGWGLVRSKKEIDPVLKKQFKAI